MTDEYYMRLALKQAEIAAQEGEIPIGAVLVGGDKVIAQAHNRTENLRDVTAHAEILAITAASHHLGAKYLAQCHLYVTLEPCPMCAGALYWAQIGAVTYGAADAKRGFSLYISEESLPEPGSPQKRRPYTLLHPKTKVQGGVLEEACQDILKTFFQNLRKPK